MRLCDNPQQIHIWFAVTVCDARADTNVGVFMSEH
jgi:hypothetical protein